MTRRMRMAQLLLVGSLGLVLLGCGPTANNADTYPVKGTVNLDGAPLPKGRIFFEDVPKGISNAADITDGAYSGQAAAGDLKARVVKTEKIKTPEGTSESDAETFLQGDISVTIKTGSNTLPPIEITTTPP